MIALRFDASDPVDNYEIRVGQIAVYDPIGVPAPPSGLVVLRKTQFDPNRATLRLGWEHSSDSIASYNVFRQNPDGSSTYLGGTPNNAYFVAEIERIDSESQTNIEVKAVGPSFTYSTPATTSFDWE